MATNKSLNAVNTYTSGYLNTALSGLGTTASVIFSQVIPAMALTTYRPSKINLALDISTGSLPSAFSMQIKFGTQSVNILNSVALTGLLSNKLLILEFELGLTDNTSTSYVMGSVLQDSSLLGLGGQPVKVFYNEMTVDGTQDQTLQVTVNSSTNVPATTIIVRKTGIAIN